MGRFADAVEAGDVDQRHPQDGRVGDADGVERVRRRLPVQASARPGL
jgi:hypothetical protein